MLYVVLSSCQTCEGMLEEMSQGNPCDAGDLLGDCAQHPRAQHTAI